MAILENVVPYQSTSSITVIREMLQYLGYEIHEIVLSGKEYGAIEKRKRLCMVAVSRGIEFSINKLERLTNSNVTVRDVMENIPADSD